MIIKLTDRVYLIGGCQWDKGAEYKWINNLLSAAFFQAAEDLN